MTVDYNKATEQQRATYLEQSHNAFRALGRAIRCLKDRDAATDDPDEQGKIRSEVPRLEFQQRMISVETHAFIDSGAQINPPTQPDFDKVKSLVQALDTMNSRQNTANQILAAATQIAAAWNNTHP